MNKNRINALGMSLDEILEENRRRNEARRVDYDPFTGKGCFGERREVKVKWSAARQHVPVTMLRDPAYPAVVANEDAFARLRHRHDFEFWAATCVKIRSKIERSLIPFVLNAPQRRLLLVLETDRLAGKPLRVILLKARQWGGSTLVQMYFAWIQCVLSPRRNSLICAQVRNTSGIIRGMYSAMLAGYPRRYWPEEKPPAFRPFEGLPGTREIVGRDCTVTVGSCYGQENTRGLDISLAHLSEVAFWKNSPMMTPADMVRAVLGGVAQEPLTAVVLESTANGVGNYFHTEWLRAVSGESGMTPVFVPWHEIEIYSRPVNDAEALVGSLDAYEVTLWQKGLTLEQINWYHCARRSYTTHLEMKREYPSTDVEAFTATGSGVFDADTIDALLKQTQAPERGFLSSESPTGEGALRRLRFRPASDGDLEVWQRPSAAPNPPDRYVVAVDVGGRTEKADYSVISVLDRFDPSGRPAIVAQWRGHCDHDLLGWRAAAVAKWYSDALLVVESNSLESGHEGESRYILEELSTCYRNIYSRTVRDTTVHTQERRLGFHTNRATKAMAVAALISAVRDSTYYEPSVEACRELAVYEQKSNGSFGARDGHHDDIVMTRAIALYVASSLRRGTAGDFRTEHVCAFPDW